MFVCVALVCESGKQWCAEPECKSLRRGLQISADADNGKNI